MAEANGKWEKKEKKKQRERERKRNYYYYCSTFKMPNTIYFILKWNYKMSAVCVCVCASAWNLERMTVL